MIVVTGILAAMSTVTGHKLDGLARGVIKRQAQYAS